MTRIERQLKAADFHSMLDWRSKYKNISISRIARVGDEETYKHNVPVGDKIFAPRKLN